MAESGFRLVMTLDSISRPGSLPTMQHAPCGLMRQSADHRGFGIVEVRREAGFELVARSSRRRDW